jgi:Domain of unknown function (DUF1508)
MTAGSAKTPACRPNRNTPPVRHQVIATSESQASAINGIESVKRNLPNVE